MCYSGLCAFEKYDGDCNFPLDKETTKQYPNRLCYIDFMDLVYYNEKVRDFYRFQETLRRKEKIEYLLNKSK